MTDKSKNETEKKEADARLKGRYTAAIGRRKTAAARIRLYRKGTGVFIVNGLDIKDYFDAHAVQIARQSLKASGLAKEVNISAVIKGGGKKSQAEAARHGIARILAEADKNLRPSLKARGWLTRDARKKERKKPGLKKARRAPQWSKR